MTKSDLQSARARIRPGEQSDLPAITRLYNHYVVETHVTFDTAPFTVSEREPWFLQFGSTGHHRLWVACDEAQLLGYCTSTPLKAKPAYDSSVEVSVYLQPNAQRRGIGTALYERLFSDLPGAHRCYALIALPNDASIALHARFGFREMGTMTEAGHKLGRYWDVLWMERNVS
ncbi:MAG: N-acetyltransferase family protein [Pseudomonadales bacterium]